MDESDSKGKWICEYCTYENFQSSQKCTMCKGLKPLINEDIFRLNPPEDDVNNDQTVEASSLCLPQKETNLNACGPCGEDTTTSKWKCHACTYLNWSKSNHCVQCLTKRSINGTSSSATLLNEQFNKIKIKSNSDLDLSSEHSTSSNLASSKLKSPVGSITNLASSRSSSGASGNHQQTTNPQSKPSYTANKWICNTCTYENWPKSMKCSMCHQSKDANNSSSSSSSGFKSDSCNKYLNDKNTQNHHNLNIMDDDNTNYCDKLTENTLSNNSLNNKHRYQLGSSDTISNCDTMQERQERRQRQLRRQVDWQWLNACLGVVDNNYRAVEAYLSCGGNPTRSLNSSEVSVLNKNSAFNVGDTLMHLAIKFRREEMLPMLLAQFTGSGPGIKRVPSYIAPDLASDIRRHFANILRVRKSIFSCHYVHEHATFALPAEIEELPIPIQEQLYDELLDRDAQKQLENPPPALNWSMEITARLGSRLLVLWNRSAGDCLLDSAMQATWGVFDRENILRRALADSLHQCGHIFYPRWKEYEELQAAMLHFTLEETQWQDDWRTLLSLASQPGSSLEALHIFALAHILRRPIIVYGVKYVKSFRGEDIGYARFEGLYLPILWEQSFCIKSPIALGYTRGHFSALVPIEPYGRIEATNDVPEDVTFLPLMDCDSKLLPIHFLTQAEMGREEAIMRQWLDVCVIEGGLLVAQQKLRKRPLLVAQMLEEWLNHYRRIAQVVIGPFGRRPLQQIGYSSDGDTDEE